MSLKVKDLLNMLHIDFMYTMLSSKYKYQICQFKQKPFDIEEVTDITGLSKNSARNLIGELTLQGLIISDRDK